MGLRDNIYRFRRLKWGDPERKLHVPMPTNRRTEPWWIALDAALIVLAIAGVCLLAATLV
jgi:hypothetical protein